MELILEEGKRLHDECSTLILPALSIGNVGQFAVDLLVSSTRADKVGYLDDPHVLPCVGNDAYGPVPQGLLALPLEAYDSPSNALTLIQQRSPLVKGMMVEFAKNLAHFAASTGKKHVIVLSSLDSGKRQKLDMSSEMQIYYLSTANADGTDGDCERIGWTRLQEYNPGQRSWKYLDDLAKGNSLLEDDFINEDELGDDDYFPSLPFAAIFSCCKAKGLKVTCILCYCSEGDNISDSFQLAEAACKLLGLRTDSFQETDTEHADHPPKSSIVTNYGTPHKRKNMVELDHQSTSRFSLCQYLGKEKGGEMMKKIDGSVVEVEKAESSVWGISLSDDGQRTKYFGSLAICLLFLSVIVINFNSGWWDSNLMPDEKLGPYPSILFHSSHPP